MSYFPVVMSISRNIPTVSITRKSCRDASLEALQDLRGQAPSTQSREPKTMDATSESKKKAYHEQYCHRDVRQVWNNYYWCGKNRNRQIQKQEHVERNMTTNLWSMSSKCSWTCSSTGNFPPRCTSLDRAPVKGQVHAYTCDSSTSRHSSTEVPALLSSLESYYNVMTMQEVE